MRDAEQEAMRDLMRAREDMKAIEFKARQRLEAFLTATYDNSTRTTVLPLRCRRSDFASTDNSTQ